VALTPTRGEVTARSIQALVFSPRSPRNFEISKTFQRRKGAFVVRQGSKPRWCGMDAVYRALDGSHARAVLSDTARRRKDRDAAARARRKGYAAGLTCGVLDAWWREATEKENEGSTAARNRPSSASSRPGPPSPPVTMSGEQAKRFFSRTGLPHEILASVWDMAKAGRRGDPVGLTKAEFESAACTCWGFPKSWGTV